jgi:hypothetical protein
MVEMPCDKEQSLGAGYDSTKTGKHKICMDEHGEEEREFLIQRALLTFLLEQRVVQDPEVVSKTFDSGLQYLLELLCCLSTLATSGNG